jgi:protease-4
MIVVLFKTIGRMVKSFWRGLTVLRQFSVNLIFLIILVAVVSFLLSGFEKKIPGAAALILAPQGIIVEQASGSALAADLFDPSSHSETLLQDLIYAIDHARTDPRVQLIVLDLERLRGGGITKLHDVGTALREFRESGKQILAYGGIFTQQQYYLAAHADRVYLDPMGAVFLTGYGVYRNYYKSALDKLLVRMHVFIVGTFKSALEPFLRDDMSAPAKTANLAWLEDLWGAYRSDMAGLRPLEPEDFDAYINRYPELLAEAGGDSARLALTSGLVDGLKTRNEVEQELIGLVGKSEDGSTFNRIELDEYLGAIGPRPRVSGTGRDQVGVIFARGMILDGVQPAGRIGGDSLAGLIRSARTNASIRALVLRLDTNGGSAFASEVIRRELEISRSAGIPVVVSMGSAAASGGYWIATAADEIWASPTTLTGSIGIFGAFATFEESLAKIGIHNDGVGTHAFSDAFIASRSMNPELAAAMQQLTERGYRLFLEKVVDGRGLSMETVEKIAEGRVWTGSRAQKIGLVDRLGDLEDAIGSAAQLAGLSDFSVVILDQPLSAREKLIRGLNRMVRSVHRSVDPEPRLERLKVLRDVWIDLTPLLQMNDPNGIYAYCLPCRSE